MDYSKFKEEYLNFAEACSSAGDLIREHYQPLRKFSYEKFDLGEDWDVTDGYVYLRFSYYCCGDTDYDGFYLPLEALGNNEEIIKFIQNKVDTEKKAAEEKARQEEINKKRQLTLAAQKKEEFDKKEYERLKKKFEPD